MNDTSPRHSDTRAPERGNAFRSRAFRIALALAVSGVAAWIVLLTVDIRAVGDLLADIDPALCIASITAFVCYQFLRTIRVIVLARPVAGAETGTVTGFARLFGALNAQGLANNVLPAGAGEVVMVFVVRTLLRQQLTQSIAVVALARIADMAILAAGAVVAFLFVASIPTVFVLAGLLLLGVAMGALAALLWGSDLLLRLAGHKALAFLKPVHGFAEQLAAAARPHREAHAVGLLILLTIGIWLANYISGLALVSALDLPLTAVQYLWVYLLTFPVNLMPFKTVGNVGTFEANWVLVLLALGFNATQAGALAVAAHLGILAVMLLSMLTALAGTGVIVLFSGQRAGVNRSDNG